MNLISVCMKIANKANKPPAALTARMKRMTADHSGRKRRGFFFGGTASCTLLDDTWNRGSRSNWTKTNVKDSEVLKHDFCNTPSFEWSMKSRWCNGPRQRCIST